jgi:hypothetical protein
LIFTSSFYIKSKGLKIDPSTPVPAFLSSYLCDLGFDVLELVRFHGLELLSAIQQVVQPGAFGGEGVEGAHGLAQLGAHVNGGLGKG